MVAASNRIYRFDGPHLVALLKDAGMRAADLAGMIGVSRPLVCLWTQDRRVIDDSYVPAIVAAIQRYDAPWFWKHVDRGDPEACWEWQGYRRCWGYGRITRHGVGRQAHRVSWELANGAIPEGKWVLHRCDNPPCVNPAHLYLGDPLTNTRDMMAKGRHRFRLAITPDVGESNHNAKLTAEKVLAIRDTYAGGGVTYKQLAEHFGVSESLIGSVISCRGWKHITHGRHACA